MVQICQISVIALSVLSNYPFLCTSVEHRTPLCQNGRGRGESDNQFPMEIFFIFFFLLYPKGRDTRSGSGKDRLWRTLRWFVLTFVLHSFRLPDAAKSPVEVSLRARALLPGGEGTCATPDAHQQLPCTRLSVGRGFWDVPVPLRPPCISPTAGAATPGASGPGAPGALGTETTGSPLATLPGEWGRL